MKTAKIQNLLAEPGSYALVLQLERDCNLQVGSLGTALFTPGIYIYPGSACGPGGLRARLYRHLQAQGTFRWHIDYLRSIARVIAVYTLRGNCGQHGANVPYTSRPECLWSQALVNLDGSTTPIPGFGSSDCRSGCQAHLVGFKAMPDHLQKLLAQVVSQPVQFIQLRIE